MAAEKRVKAERLRVFGIVVLVIILTAVYTLLQKTEEFSWRYVTNTVLFSFLGIVNFILVVCLLFILLRNLIKLLVERHRNILGSRFRTKLVFTFLGLCLIPSILLFTAALSIIERSVDRWFSTPVEKISTDARTVVDAYYTDHRARNESFAADIAARISGKDLAPERRGALLRAMEEAMQIRHVSLVSVYLPRGEPLTVASPRMPVEDLKALPARLRGRRGDTPDAEPAR